MGHADRNARAAIIAQDIGRAVDRPYGEVACGDQKRIDAYNYFMTIHEQAINNVIKKKYNI